MFISFSTSPETIENGRPNGLFSFGVCWSTNEVIALDRAGNAYMTYFETKKPLENEEKKENDET